MDQFYVKPAKKGLRVEDPETGDLLTDGGAFKPRTPHWLLQIDRGDVVETEAPAEPAPAGKRAQPDARD